MSFWGETCTFPRPGGGWDRLTTGRSYDDVGIKVGVWVDILEGLGVGGTGGSLRDTPWGDEGLRVSGR